MNNIIAIILTIFLSITSTNLCIADSSAKKSEENQYNKLITLKELCDTIEKFEQETEFKFNFKKIKNINQNIQLKNKTVKICAENGILNIRRDKNYKENDYITKQELAVVIYNIANNMSDLIERQEKEFKEQYPNNAINPNRFPHEFSDGEYLRSFAREAVNWVYRQGIIREDENKCFNFESYCTQSDLDNALSKLNDTYNNKNTKPESEYYPLANDFYNLRSDLYSSYIDIYGNTHNKYSKPVYPFGQKYYVRMSTEFMMYYQDTPPLTYIMNDKWEDEPDKLVKKVLGLNENEYFDNNSVWIFGNIASLYNNNRNEQVYVNLDNGQVYNNIGVISKRTTSYSTDYWYNSESNYIINPDEYLLMKSYDSGYYGYINFNKNIKKNIQYTFATAFIDGKAVVRDKRGIYLLIDENFNTIKNLNLDIDNKKYCFDFNGQCLLIYDENNHDYYIYNIDNEVLNKIEKTSEYIHVRFFKNGQIYSYNYDNRDNIVNNKLFDKDGNLIKAYEFIQEIDTNRYVVKEHNSDKYILIDETAKKIAALNNISNEFKGHNGLFIYSSKQDEITVMDYYGDILGTIKENKDLYVPTNGDFPEIEFINGLINLQSVAYYLPTGEFVFDSKDTE